MQANKILFATDFSNSSEAALEYATSLAHDTGALILIVHVEEPATIPYAANEYAIPEATDSAKRPFAKLLWGVIPSDS